jgi:hypothetical protein
VLGGQVYCSDPSYNLLLGVGIVLSSMTLAQELVLIRMITPKASDVSMPKKQLRDKLSLSNNDSKKGTKPERVLGTSLPSRQVFKLEATENKNLQTAKRRLSTILLEPRVDDLAVEHGKESTTRNAAPPMRDQEKAKVAYTIALSYFVFGICYGVAQYAIPILYASHGGAPPATNSTALDITTALSSTADTAVAMTYHHRVRKGHCGCVRHAESGDCVRDRRGYLRPPLALLH